MGRSGDAFKEGRGASILHGEVHIFLNFVSECGYVCKMNDTVVLRIGDGKGERAVSLFHGHDWDHDVVCPHIHLLVVRVVPFVVENGLAQGHCGVNLGAGRVSGLSYFCLESSRFGGGRREASEVCFDFRWSGGRSRTVVRSVTADCSFEPREGALRGGCIFLPFWTAYPCEQCKRCFWDVPLLS